MRMEYGTYEGADQKVTISYNASHEIRKLMEFYPMWFRSENSMSWHF